MRSFLLNLKINIKSSKTRKNRFSFDNSSIPSKHGRTLKIYIEKGMNTLYKEIEDKIFGCSYHCRCNRAPQFEALYQKHAPV